LDSATVEDVMHQGAFTCFFETSLATVARVMAAHRVHCVVGFGDATSGDTGVWGLVTDRDVVAAAATDHEHRTAGTSTASEAVTIGPREPLRRAAEVMTERGLSHLLVVEPGSDRPIGVVSTLDIAGVVGGVTTSVKPRGGTRVDELMSTPVVTVSPKTSLKDIAALLVERRISAVPVVADGEIVGIVSEGDIVGEESALTESSVLARLFSGSRTDTSTQTGARIAAEVMTAPAITVEWSEPAETAATLMIQHHVKRLLVVRDDKLVGIVSRSDLVRAYARSDNEIEREIRERVLPEGYLLQPDAVTVDVRGGEVTLEGTVESRADLEELPRRIRQVPGVVSVSDSLVVRDR
jgi:CBS domain-containing protein